MKRELLIHILQEYIVHKPNRPFEELKEFVEEIEATPEEVREAIIRATDTLTKAGKNIPIIQQKKSIFPLSGSKPNLMRNIISKAKASFQLSNLDKFKGLPSLVKLSPLLIGSFVVVIMIFIGSLSKSETLHSPTPETIKKTIIDNVSLQPKIVYANEEKIDAKRVFSFPSSGISLKYSGSLNNEIFGFFPYWMLDVQDQITLDPYTDISLFALDTDGQGNIITQNSNGEPNPGWQMWIDKKTDDLINKAKRKRIKVYLTIKSFNNDDIEKLVTSDDAQRKFIANAIQLVNMKSLNGVNIDFEYAGKAQQNVVFGFSRLIANLNSELKRQVPNSELTVDTYISSASQVNFFDVQILQDNVDALIVMGYDIHTPQGAPGPIAPMEGGNGIIGYMQSYLERVSPNKLILAVPQYAYDWIIDKNNNPTGQANILSYAEVASQNSNYKILWDDASQTPYYQYADPQTQKIHEVHFENTRSLGLKYDYIKSKKLKGVGIWAIGYDGLNPELQQLIIEKFAQ